MLIPSLGSFSVTDTVRIILHTEYSTCVAKGLKLETKKGKRLADMFHEERAKATIREK
jgi:hypothetical protein